MATQTSLPSAGPNSSDQTSSSSLPRLSDEWATSNDFIARLDERIHDTRKLVFGLFSALLTAGTVLGLKVGGTSLPCAAWVGVHVALLGLLLAGRFIERQAFHLKQVIASRALVLELLTPVELTGTLWDYSKPLWKYSKPLYSETRLIYSLLGGVSAFVSTTAALSTSDGQKPLFRMLLVFGLILVWAIIVLWWLPPASQHMLHAWRSARDELLFRWAIIFGATIGGATLFRWLRGFTGAPSWVNEFARGWGLNGAEFVLALSVLGSTLVYVGIVFWLEPGDIYFARQGQDWSFSATSCQMNETVSILLVNRSNRDIEVPQTAAKLIRLFGPSGNAIQKVGSDDVFELVVPGILFETRALPEGGTCRVLPKGRACRWIWRPSKPGLWALELEKLRFFVRRLILVEETSTPAPRPSGSR